MARRHSCRWRWLKKRARKWWQGGTLQGRLKPTRPDALSKHQKLCTADSPMKGGGGGTSAGAGGGSSSGSGGAGAPERMMGSSSNSTGNGGPAEHAEGGEPLEECEHCNRRMRPDALSKHQRICTADKPMKGVARQPQPPPQPRPPSSGMGAPRGRPTPQQPPSQPSLTPPSPRPYRPPQVQCNSKAYHEDEETENDDEENDYPGTGASYGGAAAYSSDPYGDMAEGDADASDRIPCDSCGRKFAPEALAKHARVCAKVFANKRKPFNMAKQRLQGTDAASLHRTGRPPVAARPNSRMQSAQPARQPGGAASSMPKWKAQSEALRQAMAANRQVTAALARGESLRNLPPPPSIPDPSFIQCPHCGRRFNQQAAERHIAACANTIAKPKFLKAGTGGSGAGAPQSRRLPRY
uniref:C2HC/C3H-type domain-containing protein n=1 Tax=Dunaliella tertiolecta TaxID=3047 RepID=A0A7S3VI84_DUNTE